MCIYLSWLAHHKRRLLYEQGKTTSLPLCMNLVVGTSQTQMYEQGKNNLSPPVQKPQLVGTSQTQIIGMSQAKTTSLPLARPQINYNAIIPHQMP